MRTIPVLLVLMGAVFGASGQALSQTCTSSSCQGFFAIQGDKGIHAYRSYNLASGSPRVRHLVFVVHGSSRNAYNVFSNINEAADSIGKLDETLVVSPLFKTSDDAPGADDLYWSNGGWQRGDKSYGPGVSSFEVIDHLAALVIDGGLFPNLELVTVTGHSAGGQFTQRYAVGNETQNAFVHVKFNYVPMNPSSYMYLSPYRPVAGTVDEFEIPSGCSGYDDYKYGLIGRNAYMDRLPADDLIAQYLPRHVTYLVGSDDTSRTNNLDISCEGDAQGYTRYERGQAFASYVERFFPENNHALGVAAGVGHNSTQTSSSRAGIAALFPDPSTIPATNQDWPVPMPPVLLEVN